MSTSHNSQPIRFYHRGEVVEVQGPHPTRSVLQWLREDAHCTGTKEGCNEGDCGACTVVIGELAEAGDARFVAILRDHIQAGVIRSERAHAALQTGGADAAA